MDENELEQTLRAGLERRSTEVDVTAPVVDRARAEVGRRRRSRFGAVGAAAAVVLVVGGIAVATESGRGRRGGAADQQSHRHRGAAAPNGGVAHRVLGWRRGRCPG